MTCDVIGIAQYLFLPFARQGYWFHPETNLPPGQQECLWQIRVKARWVAYARWRAANTILPDGVLKCWSNHFSRLFKQVPYPNRFSWTGLSASKAAKGCKNLKAPHSTLSCLSFCVLLLAVAFVFSVRKYSSGGAPLCYAST